MHRVILLVLAFMPISISASGDDASCSALDARPSRIQLGAEFAGAEMYALHWISTGADRGSLAEKIEHIKSHHAVSWNLRGGEGARGLLTLLTAGGSEPMTVSEDEGLVMYARFSFKNGEKLQAVASSSHVYFPACGIRYALPPSTIAKLRFDSPLSR